MSDEYNVFISWSGDKSKWVAEALREWLPLVVQSVKPWMSDTDIDKGARGLEEIGKRLSGMKVGIVCLTPENQKAPWILYEAGALSKTIGEKTRLCTYLLGGLRLQDVLPPLSMFQSTSPDKADTRKLLGTINRATSADPLSEPNLDHIFERMWPEMEEKLARMPEADGATVPRRTAEDILAEILEIARAGASDREAIRAQIARIDGALSQTPSVNYAIQSGQVAPVKLGEQWINLWANNAPGLGGLDQALLNYWSHQNQPDHNTKTEARDDQTPQPPDSDGEDPTRQG